MLQLGVLETAREMRKNVVFKRLAMIFSGQETSESFA